MAPVGASQTQYNPADHSALALPEEVFGHVDIATLADIHRYLGESESQEDIELAAWIQANYLHETRSGTSPIRTTEGFARLDRAYRRVRSLTNKAQDKWPFFDRNFKQMSSATVRNNARGEAAPGVFFPDDGLRRPSGFPEQARASPMSAFDTANASPAPQLQVPFGPAKPSRHDPHKKEFPRPARKTPVPLPLKKPSQPGEQHAKRYVPSERPELQRQAASSDDLPKYTDDEAMLQPSKSPKAVLSSELDGGRSLSSVPTSASVGAGDSVLGEDLELEPTRDAGGGKVRGPNGRYLPKEGPKSRSKAAKKSRKSNVKHVKKQEPATGPAAQEVPEPEPELELKPIAPVREEPPTDIPSPSSSTQENDRAGTIDVAVPSATASETVAFPNIDSDSASVFNTEPTPAYLLAAEADAVPSNLDRLPPNARRQAKRKSEPAPTPPDNRKRGRFGGIVGRPRKTETAVSREGGEVIQEQSSANETEAPRQMTTRRSARQSAVSNDTTLVEASPGKPAKEDNADAGEDVNMSGIEQDATAGHEVIHASAKGSNKHRAPPKAKVPAPSASKSQPMLDAEVPGIGLRKTTAPGLRAEPYQSPYQSLPTQPKYAQQSTMSSSAAQPTSSTKNRPATTNGTGSTHAPGHVELIARITTAKGIMEVPIAPNTVKDEEVEMIERYAQWNIDGDAVPIDYKQFRMIFAFAKEY